MKAELNQETKEAFFAQYWDQRSCIMPYSTKHVIPMECLYYWHNRPEDQKKSVGELSCIQLKPLSSVTIVDAKVVIEMMGLQWDYESGQFYELLLKKGVFMDYFERVRPVFMKETSGVVDYFRSKGYALPFRGITVEEMVEAGWIKLIDNQTE